MPIDAASPRPNDALADATVDDIAAFMRDCSFEATRPSLREVEALARLLSPGARIYLTAVPGRPLEEMEAAAESVARAGLTPVPHLSARYFPTLEAVDAHLRALVAGAGVREIMLIGGDLAQPRGAISHALAVIESGLLERHGLARVGLAGFPDGHPSIGEDELEANLVTKLAALQQRGLEGEIVTQFCFDARPILRWMDWLRGRGVHAPVRVGFAGPTSLLTWLNFARRCGVKASAEALASRSGLVRHAFKAVAPDPLIRSIAGAAASGRIEGARPHLFAFGGLEETARWALAPMNGAIRLDKDGGFDAA
jgi:methylenetetrahydrofolate reductase (NADPH)